MGLPVIGLPQGLRIYLAVEPVDTTPQRRLSSSRPSQGGPRMDAYGAAGSPPVTSGRARLGNRERSGRRAVTCRRGSYRSAAPTRHSCRVGRPRRGFTLPDRSRPEGGCRRRDGPAARGRAGSTCAADAARTLPVSKNQQTTP